MLKVNHLSGFGKRQSAAAPPAVTYTPVFCCGFECGQLNNVGAHWFNASGISIDTSTVRSGSRSLRVNMFSSAGSTFPQNLTGQTIQVVRFYIRFATKPTGNGYIAWANTATRIGLFFNASDSKLYCAVGADGSATIGASGVSVTTGVWYRVDLIVDQTSGARVCNAKIDGTSLGQASDSSSSSVGILRFGLGSAFTMDAYFDDFIWSNTAVDYPFGAGYVNHFVPVSDGAHNTGTAGNFKTGAAGSNITDASTTSYQLIDEVPMDDTSPDTNDFINAAANGSSNYVEHVFGPAAGISTPTTAPRAVEVMVAHHQEHTGTGNSTFKLNDNGTENTVVAFNAAGAITTRYARKHYATMPADSAQWTAARFNALRHRFGYSSAANPDQYFDGAMIEAEFQ